MKRYFFHVDYAVGFILQCLPLINKGEIFVPKMKSYSIVELAQRFSKRRKVIGLRQGEKIEEALMTNMEKKYAEEKNTMWIIRQY